MSDLAFRVTDTGHEWLIDKPVQIAIYLVLALVVRYVLHRAIDRVTRPPAGGRSPSRRVRRRQRKAAERAAAESAETPESTGSAEAPVGAEADAETSAGAAESSRPHGRRSSGRGAGGESRGTKPKVLADAGSGLTAALLRKNMRQRTAEDLRAEEHRDERRAQRLATIGSVLKSLVSFLVLMWVVLQTLGILGVNVAPFIASAGIVGVALGFGAQALVRDFLSGLFMLFEDQYGVGDWVDLGEASGTVEDVGLRVTTVRDLHGTLWYCRNGEIMRVGNYSQDFGVAFLEIPISYSADVDRACRIALETATAAATEEPMKSNLLSAPELQGVNALGPDSWTLRMTAVTRANTHWATERELRRRIRKAFDDAGIDAPYPFGLPVLPAEYAGVE